MFEALFSQLTDEVLVTSQKVSAYVSIAGLGKTNELTDVNSIRWHARNVTIEMRVVVHCEWEIVSFVVQRHDQLPILNINLAV